MAKRKVVIKAIMDIENPNAKEITDRDIVDVWRKMDGELKPVGDFQLEINVYEVSTINKQNYE